jgi:hypothetical protein
MYCCEFETPPIGGMTARLNPGGCWPGYYSPGGGPPWNGPPHGLRLLLDLDIAGLDGLEDPQTRTR